MWRSHPELPSGPQTLTPGLHVLENAALGVPSVKVDQVRSALVAAQSSGIPLWDALPALMSDHSVAVTQADVPRFPDGRERLSATLAPCVHADGYGTRSSAMVRIGADPSEPPELLVADGPPCRAPFADTRRLWSTTCPP